MYQSRKKARVSDHVHDLGGQKACLGLVFPESLQNKLESLPSFLCWALEVSIGCYWKGRYKKVQEVALTASGAKR